MQEYFIYSAAGARNILIAGSLVFAATFSAAQEGSRGAEVPVTDVARPTNAELMSNPILRNALSRSSEGLVFQRAPAGVVGVDLQGRFQNVSVARIDVDGEIRVGCADSHDSLAEFLAAHPGSAAEQDLAGTKEHRDDQ